MPIKLNGETSGSVELDVPAAVSGGDITFTLPNGVGSAEQVLKNSGSAGALEFGTAGLTSMQVFTSSGTWTKPSGITRIKVYVTAGGGGGGAANTDDTANGGGAGGTAIKVIDVTSISSETVTVGGGGAGAPHNTNSHVYGGTSSFGTHCSGTGGSRYGGGWSLAGRGGVATGGDLNITGGDGGGGNIDVVEHYHTGGTGGSSYWGQGGRGGASIYNDTHADGRAYGSGGGGAADSEWSSDGAPGVVVVEEYS